MSILKEYGASVPRLCLILDSVPVQVSSGLQKGESSLNALFLLAREDLADLCVATSLLNMRFPGSYYFLLISGTLSKPRVYLPC